MLKKPLNELRHFIEAFPASFIQGFVDSEGSIPVAVCKANGRIWLQPSIAITNCDLELLEFTKNLLKSHFDIESRIKPSHMKGSVVIKDGKISIRTKDAFDLKIYGIENLKQFYEKLNFTIERKQQKLKDIIDIFNIHKPVDRVNVWLNMYEKHNKRWVKKNWVK